VHEGDKRSWSKSYHANAEGINKARAEYRKQWYEKNKSKQNATTMAYAKTEKGKASARQSYLNLRQYSPQKYLARMEAQKAIRKGELIPMPCLRCGNSKTEAHHEDYSKPLDVLWLCNPCHRQLHRTKKKIPATA
jgi:hypothetical protein